MTLELRKPSEHEEQTLLVNWSKATASLQPVGSLERLALERFHSIPNGAAVARKEGVRRPGAKQGGKLKAEGLNPDIPDLFLPYAVTIVPHVNDNYTGPGLRVRHAGQVTNAVFIPGFYIEMNPPRLQRRGFP